MDRSDKSLEEITTTHALEYYINHLEFLGYSVDESDEFSIACNHPRRDFIRLLLLDSHAGVMAQIVYALPDKFQNDLIPLYMYANELNRSFLFMKAYIISHDSKPPIIILNSVLEGEYSRQNFAIFMDNIEQDMRKFHSYPKTQELWRSDMEDEILF